MPMKFPYLNAARVKLQEKKNACLKAKYDASPKFTGYFLAFLKADPITRPIVAELAVKAEQKFSDINQLVDLNHRCLNVPDLEDDCAAFCFKLLETFAGEKVEIPGFHMIFGGSSRSLQAMTDDFFSQVLLPLCSYIDGRIDDGDLLLYMLSRYQRECGWFESASLAALAGESDSNKLEAAFDSHLRKWLFNQGIDYPFSTPKSPSGRADIIVWQGEEPLPMEVKVFDGKSRDSGHVSQGLWQAHRYAGDFGKPFGYLVVFNTSDSLLSFENNKDTDGPPCIEIGSVNVFAIVINVGERLSASKETPLATKLVKAPSGPSGAR